MGREIVARREARGMSQTALAYLIGVTNKQLYNVEKGRNWPSMPVYITLCKVLMLPKPPML